MSRTTEHAPISQTARRLWPGPQELPPLPCQPPGGCRVVVPLPAFAMRAGVRDTVYFAPEKVGGGFH